MKELLFKICSAMDFWIHILGFNTLVRGIGRKESKDLVRAILWKVQKTFTDVNGNLKEQILQLH